MIRFAQFKNTDSSYGYDLFFLSFDGIHSHFRSSDNNKESSPIDYIGNYPLDYTKILEIK